MELKTFRISYKLYYHELCDWGSEQVKAAGKTAALRKFARRHRVLDADIGAPHRWRWWKDDWFYAFHSIRQIGAEPTTCPLREGCGAI